MSSETTKFVAKKEISMKHLFVTLSDAFNLPKLKEGLRERNIEFEATLPDVRIDCFLFLAPQEMELARQGILKEPGTINILHIKAIGDQFTEKNLQTYIGQGLIVNGSDKVDNREQVVLLIICSEKPSNTIFENRFFGFTPKDDEPWIYRNRDDWFFPVRIIVLNEIELTDENLSIYFPFVPFISDRAKFLEFFPKIQNLNIPEHWKFWCEVFASKTNPLYQEVERMDYHFLDLSDIELLLSHTPKSLMPGVFGYLLERTPTEMIPEALETFIAKAPPERIPEVVEAAMAKTSPEIVSQTLSRIVNQMSAEQKKEFIEEISNEKEKV